MGMFFVPQRKAAIYFKPVGGYGSFSWKDDSDDYEDYTSVLGRVNIYDDYYQGEFKKENDLNFGMYFLTTINKYAKSFIITQAGLVFHKKQYFDKYYDPLEILGNNGNYYIESKKNSESSIDFEFGVNYANAIGEVIFDRYYYYFFIGVSYLTYGKIIGKIGIVASF